MYENSIIPQKLMWLMVPVMWNTKTGTENIDD